MRRALLALLLALVPLLAGCATLPPDGQAAAPITPAPMTSASSATAPSPALYPFGFRCPHGEAVVAFDAQGTPECAPFMSAPTYQTETTRELSSRLKVVGIYGTRPDATTDLDTLRVVIELAAGDVPVDLSKLITRMSDGTAAGHYQWASGACDDTAGSGSFVTTWIRGEEHAAVMEPGDLVEICFAPSRSLPTRTEVMLTLIPEVGPAVAADFRTPATYGGDLTITLR